MIIQGMNLVNFNVTNIDEPHLAIDYIVVAGGGGGAYDGAGGGGGGGVLIGNARVYSAPSPYSLTVGSGGTGRGPGFATGGSGGNSTP